MCLYFINHSQKQKGKNENPFSLDPMGLHLIFNIIGKIFINHNNKIISTFTFAKVLLENDKDLPNIMDL